MCVQKIVIEISCKHTYIHTCVRVCVCVCVCVCVYGVKVMHQGRTAQLIAEEDVSHDAKHRMPPDSAGPLAERSSLVLV